MKHIKNFSSYLIKEDAGYGNDYFVNKKIDKSQYYFFKTGEGEEETGIIIKIGKFSREGIISESEKSYCVVHIEQISPNDMDDYLVNDSEYQSNEDLKFSLSPDILSQAFKIYKKTLDDYLEKNPKVTKIYDEILENLDMESEEYKDFISSVIRSWSKKRWTIQEGASQNVLIYTKTSHG
jgi:hypothetical protein